MGEVIALHIDNPSSFTITATIDASDIWNVDIEKFYNQQMPMSEVYREIAEALVPIAGGMIASAEELDPTTRGNLIVNISVYQSGYVDMRTQPIDTAEKLNWLFGALEIIRQNAIDNFERQKSS